MLQEKMDDDNFCHHLTPVFIGDTTATTVVAENRQRY